MDHPGLAPRQGGGCLLCGAQCWSAAGYTGSHSLALSLSLSLSPCSFVPLFLSLLFPLSFSFFSLFLSSLSPPPSPTFLLSLSLILHISSCRMLAWPLPPQPSEAPEPTQCWSVWRERSSDGSCRCRSSGRRSLIGTRCSARVLAQSWRGGAQGAGTVSFFCEPFDP